MTYDECMKSNSLEAIKVRTHIEENAKVKLPDDMIMYQILKELNTTVDCIWCTPMGDCGPSKPFVKCRAEGCPMQEPRTVRIPQEPPKRPVSGGSEEERLP